jgi:hypothetical protein
MRDQWNCYRASDEEAAGGDSRRRQQHLFSMRRCSLVLQSSSGDEALVHMCGNSQQSFRVQGSFWRRSCKIREEGGEEVARITRKQAGGAASLSGSAVTLGDDVFSLTVMPNADCAMIMAFVVIMDRICQKPYAALMCSSYSS